MNKIALILFWETNALQNVQLNPLFITPLIVIINAQLI